MTVPDAAASQRHEWTAGLHGDGDRVKDIPGGRMIPASAADFAEPGHGSYTRALDEQARRKGVRPIVSADELRADVFESDEELKEFLADLEARWAEKRRWGTRGRSELARWLSNAIVLPYDERVAWKWGQLTAVSERRGAGPARSMTPGSQRAAWWLTCRWRPRT